MKIGIALGGGGAKGVAHIGVLRVLESAGLQFDIVAGTSAGAIAGSLYAAGKSADEIETAVRRLRLQQLLTRDRTGMGLFNTAGIRRFIESELGKTTRIEDLPRAFAAVAVDMDSGEEAVFDAGLVADAVCASAAFPGLYAPVRINGRCYFDGGVRNPVPFDVVRRRGADLVLAVDLGADDPVMTAAPSRRRRDELLYRFLSLAGDHQVVRVASRAIGILSQQMRLQKLKESPPDLIMAPKLECVGLMDFDLADECIQAGEQAARDAVPQIDRLLHRPRWWYRSRRVVGRMLGAMAVRQKYMAF